MPKYNVSIDRQLRCRLCFDIEVEDDTVDLGDLEVRDCEYSDDEITLLEE